MNFLQNKPKIPSVVSFKNIKTDKSLSRQTFSKKKRKQTTKTGNRDYFWPLEIKRIMRKYYEQLCVKEFDYWNEMDKFLEKSQIASTDSRRNRKSIQIFNKHRHWISNLMSSHRKGLGWIV